MEAGSSSHMSYDVFISFNRHEKERRYQHFTKHLYKSLCRWGMKVFIDNDNHQSDNMIVKAIEGSKTFIIVVSKEYASSKLCLRELVKIMDQINKTTHQVLPLFCHYTSVPRGDSKEFFDEYKNALQEFIDNHEEEDRKEEVQEGWKEAISEVCSRSGIYVRLPPDNRKTRKMIFDKLLHLKFIAENRYLLEIPLRLGKMETLLNLNSNDDIRFIGIVGMDGIGKTTIAQILYHKFAHTFRNHCCFLQMTGYNNNVVSLQQQLLSQLSFTTNELKIMDENHGVRLIKMYLSELQKVLLILDGISDTQQLRILVGYRKWLGPGSRIIITTKNKDILRQTIFKHKVVEYNVELLSHTSAFSLFCKYAFGECNPEENFKEISNEIIEKVGTLPLALVRIASSLNGQGIDKWEEMLKSYHEVIYADIFSNVLKSSYEALEVESQQIFLDLACFLNGEQMDRVIQILEAFGYTSLHTELQLLADRFFIDISDREIIKMHTLILCIGQEIARRESGARQPIRIWLREDARRLFYEKCELKYIQGIVLDLEEEEELVLEAKSFADMSELKILQINNVQLFEDIEYMSNKLTLLNWPGYPSKCLPSTFQPLPLLELHLPGSNIERLWNGRKKFENLKEIDASDSKYLVETPDFSEVPNIQRLILRNCERLQEVHYSINNLDHLVLLDMAGCVSFKSFSSPITCERLRTLVLSNSGLEFFPKFGLRMKYMTELHIDGTSINQLPPTLSCLYRLALLNLRNCIRLSSLPTEIGSLRSLRTLILNGCKNLDQIPSSLKTLWFLAELDIGGTSISVIPFLRNLKILNCERLKSNIWHFLAGLPSYSFRSLKDLNLSDCNLVDEDIPNDLKLFSSLEILDLSSNHFERLPESIQQLINLKALYLNDCQKLKQVPKLPPSLQYVGGEKSLNMLRNSQGSSANTTSCSLSYLLSNAPLIPLVSSCQTLFGIEDQVEKVCNLLDLERFDEVRIVGIFGSGGIGKTSLAEVVFNTIAKNFEGSCFIYISKENNLVLLQLQMLSQLVSKEIRGWDDDQTEKVVRDLVIGKKVFIVLDGVDEGNQIEKLVGSPDWFAPGSRFVITTRNRDVVDQLNYGDKLKEYNVELLSHESAYSLFCNNALGDNPCDKKEVCNEIVEKVGRLPLALKTIGSYLHNKDLAVWNETLKRLDEVEQDFFGSILKKSHENSPQH